MLVIYRGPLKYHREQSISAGLMKNVLFSFPSRNALNIVKDDLIARVDQLTSEKDVCEERLRQTESQRDAARERVEALETEIKRLKVCFFTLTISWEMNVAWISHLMEHLA